MPMQTDKKLSTHEFPNQRVSDKEKRKKSWYIPCTNYIIDRAISVNNKQETISNLRAANGEIDEESIQYVLRPYSKSITDIQGSGKNKFPDTIRKIDYITPIKERYLGEFIKQYSNYQVYIHDSDAVFQRNRDLAKAVEGKLIEEFVKLVESHGEEDIQHLDFDKFAKDFIEEWVDERVIDAQKRVNLLNDLIDAGVVYIQQFFYWWATEECYSYRHIVSNEVRYEVVAPWEYYRIDSGNLFVEDDDMGMRKYKMSINQVIDIFRDKLDEEDLNYVRSLLDKHSDDGRITVPHHLIRDRAAFNLYNYANTVTTAANYDLTDSSRMIDVYHCIWKTEKKIKILTYVDGATGEIKEIEVPADYKLDEFAGDLDLRTDWINEVWHSYRFGGRDEGFYLPAEPIEVQREEINNSSICKLPYNGIKGLLKNNDINPIPKRLIIYQELLRLYNYQREKAIAKFKTFNLIPESLLLDGENMTLEERLSYAAVDDILPFNDADVDPAVLQGIKNLYNQGAERYIQILSEVIETIKKEAMDMANMNEQRFGDIDAQAGKSVTEYAITKATTGSILMFEMFNKFRERDYMANLDFSKAAWINGKTGSYIDPSTKGVMYVDIDGIEHLGTNLGIFIRNSHLEEEKLQQYREVAFSASQNGDFSLAADAIHSDNSTEIRRLIKKADEARKEHEKQIEEARNALQAQLAQKEEQLQEAEKIHEEKLTLIKEQYANERKVAELEVKLIEIDAKFTQAIDTSLPDEAKQAMEQAKFELDKRRQELEELKAMSAMAKDKEPAQT